MSELTCTECHCVFTEAQLAAEDKTAWGHPCHGVAGEPDAVCESFREPLGGEQRRILGQRRAMMPDYDERLEEWLS